MVPFLRLLKLPPTPVPHIEMRIDIGQINWEGLEGPRRKTTCKKDNRGKFVSKYEWPEIERKKRLSPIERLDEPIDLSKLS